jgi:predicted transcriptional regulator
MNVARRRDYLPVDANCDIEDIVQAATTQNFVPVVDDSRAFIGLITRKEVIRYLCDSLEKSRGAETASAVKTPLSQVSSDPTDDPLGGRIHENVGEFKAIF